MCIIYLFIYLFIYLIIYLFWLFCIIYIIIGHVCLSICLSVRLFSQRSWVVRSQNLVSGCSLGPGKTKFDKLKDTYATTPRG